MNTETFDNPADFLTALKGKRPKRAAVARERAERTGLSTLLLAGWCIEYNAAMEMRLYKGATTTAYYADEKQACDEAKELLK